MDLNFWFVLGKGFSSWLIGWKGVGRLSHVDIELDGQKWGARSDWIKGIKPGVEPRPMDYEKWKRVVKLSIPVTTLQYEGAKAFAASQQDVPYDKREIKGFALGKRLYTPGLWICSRFAMGLAKSIDLIKWETYLPDDEVDPTMCCNVLSTIKTAKIEVIAP